MSTTASLELDGLRHEFDEVPGATDRAPLLFLHEGLGSVGLWRGFHHRIAAATGRRTVAWSRLGYGRSDRPRTPRTSSFLDEEAARVPELCAALGLERPVLVGHSDGATIALLTAASTPVSGVVVMAPHVLVEEMALPAIRAARDAFTDGDLRVRMARHHDDPDAAFFGWNDVWLSAEFRDWDIRGRLGAITAPVLGIQGADDHYGTDVHVRAVAERAAGPVTLLDLPCGHSPHLELPDRTAAAITDFVAALR